MGKTIWIKCKQVCEYNQQHTVTDAEYDKLMEDADGGDVEEPMQYSTRTLDAYHIIDGYLNHTDILDTGREFTDISIELDVPEKKKRKSIAK